MTVKFTKRGGFNLSRIKGEWLHARVRAVLEMKPDDQRQQVSRLINIERQFGGKDLDALLELRDQINERRRDDDHGLPDNETRTYDVE